ncbi:MAG: DUF4360 domain-containing protein [Cocleimonas sp.]|nr:DUF4360 domain-containing protein [Cocleimonas sp.]
MKTLKSIVAITFLALTASQASMATPSKNTVHFKAPATAGNGCPGNSTSHAITPDGTTLSILFDKYVAEPGNKSCNIAIPVHVPNGFQVSTLKADFRGFVEGRAELRRSYFFAGQSGPSKRNKLSSRGGKDYLLRDNLLLISNNWSKCGEDVNLRINSRIRTKNKRSFVSVDSLDLKTGMIFKIQYRRCSR